MRADHLIGALTVCLALFSGCSTAPRALTTSERVESASGSVKVDSGAGDSKTVDLDVSRLEKASALNPDAKAYVVWFEPLSVTSRQPGSLTVTNAGTLAVAPDGTGKFKASSPYPRFRLFVTAEPDPANSRPTGAPILWSDPLGD